MKKITVFLLTLLVGLSAWADIPEGYYYNAVGKQDEELMTALEGIINYHSQLGYNFLWDCYPYTDAVSLGSDIAAMLYFDRWGKGTGLHD